jgi:hypothetical protein
MPRNLLIAACAVLVAIAPALAEEPIVALKDAPGRDVVDNKCAACHWEAEVSKMINAFGAPIAPTDAKTIIDYLARNYGGTG